jgi:ketosteroid isomerase-like protein
MKKTLLSIAGLALIFVVTHSAIGDHQTTTEELNAFWSEVSRTVSEGDFYGMAATYHDDAILVNGTAGSTYPIASALEGWKPDIDRTKSGEVSARVEFRFSRRLNDATTAHETGIFHYSATPKGGEMTEYYVHFEGLLVKKGSNWRMMMENQISSATAEEFNELDPVK